jgi:flagellar basal body-associated protein FliL
MKYVIVMVVALIAIVSVTFLAGEVVYPPLTMNETTAEQTAAKEPANENAEYKFKVLEWLN